MKLLLTINSGTLAGQRFELETGFLTIGRGETCSIRFDPLNERIASKQHAFIEAKPDGYYVTDNNSTNGTLLNGQVISASAKINSGDTIQFGKNGVTATASIEGSSFDAPAAQSFRDYQVEQFNQTAQQEPQDFQTSLANFGLGGAQEIVKEPSRTGKYVGIGITLFAIVFFALVVCGIMLLSVGPVAAIIASVVAFIPVAIYILPLIWLDRYDPEPVWLLALAFGWGALVAVVFSFIINSVAGAIAGGVSAELGEVVGAVISAPIVEEGSKGLGLLILLLFFRRYFDDILDGIVFAGVIALGFATIENILYYGRAIAESGLPGMMILFVVRGILSPFAHVTFTSMTGIGCGIARESHKTWVKILFPVMGYIGAVSLHALWNGMAVFGGFGKFLIGYLIVEIPFFLIFTGFALYIMHRQNKILKEMLAIDIATGLIPGEHAKKAMSAFRSSGWVIGGIFDGKFKARSRYVRAIGKLGLSYWHIQRATAAQGQTGSFQQNPILREEVLKWRDKV
jgi:RsiW-degrading membrane proteinase PrsW (M82 family)